MGVSDVELCHPKNILVSHSNVIINTIANEVLFLKREKKEKNGKREYIGFIGLSF
jgi:hypothetical protein